MTFNAICPYSYQVAEVPNSEIKNPHNYETRKVIVLQYDDDDDDDDIDDDDKMDMIQMILMILKMMMTMISKLNLIPSLIFKLGPGSIKQSQISPYCSMGKFFFTPS